MKDSSKKLINKLRGFDLIRHGVIPLPQEIKKSPLHQHHKNLSAHFIAFGHSLWVDRYNEYIDNEYEALNNDVAVSDISCVTMVSLKASNVLGLLKPYFSNRLVTNKTHVIRYGALIGMDGKLFDDAILFICSEHQVWLTLNVSFPEFMAFLKQQPDLDDLTVDDLTDKYIKILIQGPHAYPLLFRLFVGVPLIKPFTFINLDDCIISASGFTRPGGYEVFLPIAKGISIWEQLIQIGITPFGISTMEISRVEARMICYGHEFYGSQQTPQELGFMGDSDTSLTHVVKFALFKHNPKRIVHPPKIGDLVYTERGEVSGIMTSVVFSPHYNAYIGFCSIKHGVLMQETELFASNEPFITLPLKKNGLK